MHFHFVFMSVDLLQLQEKSVQDSAHKSCDPRTVPEPNKVLKSEKATRARESSWVLRAWYSTTKWLACQDAKRTLFTMVCASTGCIVMLDGVCSVTVQTPCAELVRSMSRANWALLKYPACAWISSVQINVQCVEDRESKLHASRHTFGASTPLGFALANHCTRPHAEMAFPKPTGPHNNVQQGRSTESSETKPHADSPQRVVLAQNRSVHNDPTCIVLKTFKQSRRSYPGHLLKPIFKRDWAMQKGRDGGLRRDLRGMKTRVWSSQVCNRICIVSGCIRYQSTTTFDFSANSSFTLCPWLKASFSRIFRYKFLSNLRLSTWCHMSVPREYVLLCTAGWSEGWELFKSVVGSQPAPPTLSAFAELTGRRHCEWHSVKWYQHFLPHVAELEPSEILVLLLFPRS